MPIAIELGEIEDFLIGQADSLGKMVDVEFKSQDLISDSYPHTHTKQYPFGAKVPKYIYFFFNLMLNLINIENDAVFNEICKKKRRLN